MEKCKECKRPLKTTGKRNKDKELPYEIKLEISKRDIDRLKMGDIKSLWWQIRDKRKLGYCEITLEKSTA